MKERDNYLIITIVIAAVLSLLYVYKIIHEGITAGGMYCIIMNIVYIPLVIIFKRKAFAPFFCLYGSGLVFVIGFYPSMLYNNFTAFFILCIIIYIRPQIKFYVLGAYLLIVSLVFMLNSETVCHYMIHVLRTVFYFLTFNEFINMYYQRKILDLTEDEKKILDQLIAGKQQKEIDGYSKNTITKKLKDARERNGLKTNNELIMRYSVSNPS